MGPEVGDNAGVLVRAILFLVVAHQGDPITLARLSFDLSRAPEDLHLHLERAHLGLRLGDHGVMRAELDWLALHPCPHAEALITAARLHAALGDPLTARALLTLAIELDPLSPGAYRERARIQDGAGATDDFCAAALLSTAPDAWDACARSCVGGDACDPVEWYLLGHAATGAAALELAAVQTMIAAGDRARALAVIDRKLAARPSSALWRTLRAEVSR
jgi:hypothetical protein